MATLTSMLTEGDAHIINYLDCLANPDAQPARVPIVVGNFELETNTYRVEYAGAAVAGSNGVGCVGVSLDGWLLNNANPPAVYQQFHSYSGGSAGYPVWASNATVNPTATPGNNIAPGSWTVDTAVVLDPAWDSYTTLRCTSAHLEVWSDASRQTAQGDITLAVVRNESAMKDIPLNAATYATVRAYPQDYVCHAEYPLSGWKSGSRAHVHVVPYTEECFDMNQLPTNGRTNAGWFNMVAVAAGMASGQSFQYRVVMTFESTRPVTYATSIAPPPMTYSDVARVTSNLQAIHRPPTMAPVGGHSNKGVAAFAAANPEKRPAIVKGDHSPSVMNILTDTAKTGLSWLAGQIPYVGGLASKAVDWLFS
jgi:hypothetical protein